MLAPKTPTRYGRIRAYALIIRARTCKKIHAHARRIKHTYTLILLYTAITSRQFPKIFNFKIKNFRKFLKKA